MRGGSDPTMMFLLLLMMMSSSSSVAAGAYYYFNLGEEGDVCTEENGDPLGVYKRDEDLKCVRTGCVTGTTLVGSNCVVDFSGVDCIGEAADGTLYVTNEDKVCEFSMCEDTHIFAKSVTTGAADYCQEIDCTPTDGSALENSEYALDKEGECVRTCATGYTLNTDGVCVADTP